MLKKRLVATLAVKNGIVVQSFGFRRYLPVGRAEIAMEFLNQWGIDEIVLTCIDADRASGPDLDMLSRAAKRNFVPLSYGGGVSSVEHMHQVLNSGADKIVVNSAFLENPEIVSEGAKNFGAQCMVVSIDGVAGKNGYAVFHPGQRKTLERDPVALATQATDLGAGEIFLNSVDRDGSKLGYDLRLAEAVAQKINIPLILCGGAATPEHFRAGLSIKNVSAVAAGNFFHFTEHSATTLKSCLNQEAPDTLRSESHFNYDESKFDPAGRAQKKADKQLREMLFEHHVKEVI